jgi:hypothetical protein
VNELVLGYLDKTEMVSRFYMQKERVEKGLIDAFRHA